MHLFAAGPRRYVSWPHFIEPSYQRPRISFIFLNSLHESSTGGEFFTPSTPPFAHPKGLKVLESCHGTHTTLDGEIVRSSAMSNEPGTSEHDSLSFHGTETFKKLTHQLMKSFVWRIYNQKEHSRSFDASVHQNRPRRAHFHFWTTTAAFFSKCRTGKQRL